MSASIENPSQSPSKKKVLVYRIVFTLALVGLLIASAVPLTSPRAVAATVTTTRFSAMRAMDDLRVVAKEPHAAGSPAQAKVRDYILAQVAAAGLQGEVQKSGKVENILVRIPGSDSTGTVLITGHYDSHPPAPGAGDDGISAAAMLETLRVLSTAGPLQNDLLFLFSDGEESGYLGSKAYLNENPHAKAETGVLLCFDARPGNGPLTLQETSRQDAWLLRQFAASRPALLANSRWNNEERGEIDTDCTVFFAAGYHGVELENEPRGTLYHTAGDTVEAISPRLVQDFGNTMLRSAQRFGQVDFSRAEYTRDVHFFSVAGIGILGYPTWLTPISAILALLLFIGLVVLAARRKRISIKGSLLGAAGYLAAAILITVLAALIWQALLAVMPTSRELTLEYVDFAGSAAWKLGILLLAFILCVAALYGLARKVNIPGLATGGILVFTFAWWLAFLALDSDNPLSTPHLAWTMLGGVAGLAALLLVRRPAWLLVCLFLAAIPILVPIVPMLGILAFQEPYLSALALATVVGILVPQLAVVMGWEKLEG